MRVLIIEDDTNLLNSLKSNLESECMSVDIAEDGNSGCFLACTNDYDLIILDYVLPKKNGLEVCSEIRKQNDHVPIIMLSGRSEIDTKVKLLNSGADDYLTKPYSYEELLARINALLRRPKIISSTVLQIDDLVLDCTKHIVERGNKKIYLTRKEFSLLEYLMKNQDTALSRGVIMEHVWDMNADPFSNTIEAHILSLRKKINLPKKKKLIHTIPGIGYKISTQNY